MKKIISTIGVIALAAMVALLENYQNDGDPQAQPHASTSQQTPATSSGAATRPVAAAFASRRSNQVLVDSGRVIKVLPDDNKGSRHQRFLVQMPDQGPTILIAHNIDLAPRVANLREGDQVRFKGEYEWTEKGGVVHWTHHDPRGNHPGGWIELDGERYE